MRFGTPNMMTVLRSAVCVVCFGPTTVLADDVNTIGSAFQSAMTLSDPQARIETLSGLSEQYLDVATLARILFDEPLPAPTQAAVLEILDQSLVTVLGRHRVYRDLTVSIVPVASYSEPMATYLCATARAAYLTRLTEVSEALVEVAQLQLEVASARVQAAEDQLEELRGDLQLLRYGIYPEARDLLGLIFGFDGEDGGQVPAIDRTQIEDLLSALNREQAQARSLADASRDDCRADAILFSPGDQPTFSLTVVSAGDHSGIVTFDSGTPRVSLRALDTALDGQVGDGIVSALSSIYIGE